MDHRQFLSELPPDERARLTAHKKWRGLVHLAGHVTIIVILGFWVGLGLPFWQIAVFPLGVALVFLFTLEHECTHKTPFAFPIVNEMVGHMCGVVLVLPFVWFRYFHLAHHRWTNIPGKDPELASARPKGALEIAVYLSGFPYWFAMKRQVLDAAFGAKQADYIPTTALPKVRTEARIMLLIYLGILSSFLVTDVMFWIWILPVAVGQPVLRLYLLAEHGDCPQVTNMFENTRTVFTIAVVRFFAWNMPYHAEHHIFPAVPFYRLPDLHRRVKSGLKVTADGYREFTKNYLKN